MHDKKYKMENKILKLSLTGTIIFTVVEVIAAVLLGSKTVIADGIFDLFDLMLLLPMSIFVQACFRKQALRIFSDRISTCSFKIHCTISCGY